MGDISFAFDSLNSLSPSLLGLGPAVPSHTFWGACPRSRSNHGAMLLMLLMLQMLLVLLMLPMLLCMLKLARLRA